jgi:RecA-family ATPase
MHDLLGASVLPPTYVLTPLIPSGEVTLLTGHGGTGKSQLALTIAAHVACGKRWAGLNVRDGRVVFLSLEDPPDVVRFRLKGIVNEYGLETAEIERNLVVLDGTAGDSALARNTGGHGARISETDLMKQLDCYIEGSQLVVIDNASDAFDGDENSRREVRCFMQMIARRARQEHFAALLLAHVDKDSAKYGGRGNSYSGSTAWHNSARSRITLIGDKKGGSLRVVQEKLNCGRKHPDISLVWTNQGVLVTEAYCILGSIKSEVDVKERDRCDDQKILSAMHRALAGNQNVGMGRAGQGNSFACLKNFDQLGKHFEGARDRFWDAINRLEKSGQMQSEEYQTDQRKPRFRRVLCASSHDAKKEELR